MVVQPYLCFWLSDYECFLFSGLSWKKICQPQRDHLIKSSLEHCILSSLPSIPLYYHQCYLWACFEHPRQCPEGRMAAQDHWPGGEWPLLSSVETQSKEINQIRWFTWFCIHVLYHSNISTERGMGMLVWCFLNEVHRKCASKHYLVLDEFQRFFHASWRHHWVTVKPPVSPCPHYHEDCHSWLDYSPQDYITPTFRLDLLFFPSKPSHREQRKNRV